MMQYATICNNTQFSDEIGKSCWLRSSFHHLRSLQDPTKRVARAVLSIGRLFSAEAQERLSWGKLGQKLHGFPDILGYDA